MNLLNYFGKVPSGAELVTAIPVILSLVLIEGLLSVDNAMGIAALASHLPKKQQILSLRLGIIGAYAFRGLAMAFASWVAGNPWIKIVGAAYLIYLMASNLASGEGEDNTDVNKDGIPDRLQRGFIATVFAIEMMDLSLSIDNVVAAVALDKRIWVVCTGVFIGILALRFVAGYCIRLIERFPVLQKTAFLLIGFVGTILVTELSFEMFGIDFEFNAVEKFAGIILITVATLLYSETTIGKKVFEPVVRYGMPVLVALDWFFSKLFWPIAFCFSFCMKQARRLRPVQENA